MSIILEIITFVIVIVVLILVHELGHFIVAKLSKMRVDEFGVGYPPRALTFGKIGETEYTLNWLPFGGFVRIFGEDGMIEDVTEESDAGEGAAVPTEEKRAVSARAFSARPRILQALVLLAGIAMNVLFAYVLITATLIMGTQQELTPGQEGNAKNVELIISSVRPDSPAATAGFMVGDVIKDSTIITKTVGIGYPGTNPYGFVALVGTDKKLSPMLFSIDRNGKTISISATPTLNVIPGSPAQPAIGVSLLEAGVVKTPVRQAFKLAGITVWNMTKDTAVGLYEFFKSIVLFKADFSQVSGPIGIAGIVGQASANGLAALLSLTALISINLALINLLPIPALDGGRLLFVIIEAVIRRPIKPSVANTVNAVGFSILILLMVVVSAHDIFRLVVH